VSLYAQDHSPAIGPLTAAADKLGGACRPVWGAVTMAMGAVTMAAEPNSPTTSSEYLQPIYDPYIPTSSSAPFRRPE
jgi:hypothetical protein